MSLIPHSYLRIHLVIVIDDELTEGTAALLPVAQQAVVVPMKALPNQAINIRCDFVAIKNVAEDGSANEHAAKALGILLRILVGLAAAFLGHSQA